jgi:hypothetical protein
MAEVLTIWRWKAILMCVIKDRKGSVLVLDEYRKMLINMGPYSKM